MNAPSSLDVYRQDEPARPRCQAPRVIRFSIICPESKAASVYCECFGREFLRLRLNQNLQASEQPSSIRVSGLAHPLLLHDKDQQDEQEDVYTCRQPNSQK